jgi:hypothetical protein
MNNAENMTINDFNILDLAIECINKTSQDKRGSVQIAQGMGLLPNDVEEGYNTDYFLNQINADIESRGRSNFGGMVWRLDETDTDFYLVSKM